MTEREGIWTFAHPAPTGSTNLQRVELEVGDATVGFTPDEFREVLLRLLGDLGFMS
jgi:hypothetical protein